MLVIFAFLLFAIGWIWTVVLGFKESVLWGVLNILFPPISTVVFAITQKTAFVPTLLVIAGVLTGAFVVYVSFS
jgi:hypothetical protein